MAELNFSVGDYIKLQLAKKEIEGTALDSHDSGTVLIKLNSGYNIGILKENILGVKVVRKYKEEPLKKIEIRKGAGKHVLGMIVTGGTIAARLDPKTGGVKPLEKMEDFAAMYKELFQEYSIKKVEVPFKVDSSQMTSSDWKNIANSVAEMLNDNEIEGVIVTHGTDTLHYTASALSFFLRDLNKPVVLTYSQRSIDRASSDAIFNLMCAAKFAVSDCAEVVIVGHSSMNDDFCYAMRGTKVRKMHSSRRDAFKAINCNPIAKVWQEKVEFISGRRPRNKEKVELDDSFSDKVALVQFYPGQDAGILDYYKSSGYKGIVIEVLGMGNISLDWLAPIKKLVKEGIAIFAVGQTIYGRINPKVYAPGRELEKAGVVYLEDMLPETALVKLGWILGHRSWKGEKIKEKMFENFAGEFNELLSE